LKKSLFAIFLVLISDQVLKFWVKLSMTLSEEIPIVGNWFNLYFTENNGMAFGLQFGGEFGKLFLSIFRILAIIAIAIYLIIIIRRNRSNGLIISISLIFAGALGNIIDSAFYGMMFSESYYQVAQFMPEAGGYSGFLHGKVVDMLYFPLIEGHFPAWFPFWSNDHFIFFRPVFNIADSSISVGIAMVVLFYRSIILK